MEYRDRSRGGSFSSPVNIGDEFDVKIEAVGEKGDGLAKKDGFVLFVPNTQQGDQVKIRVTKVLRKVGFAEVVGKSEGGSESQEGGQVAAEDTENFGEEPKQDDSEKSEDESSEE